ncbi:MAG: hypothetical protein JJU16_05570 [Alkalibacterium sp.]|nr:hypothetical protein [Alkalibacterium sp.]
MKLLMYGVNRDTVSSEDIHKYSLTQSDRREHLRDISAFDGVEEVVLLVTDNRNEYYLFVDEKDFKHGDLLRYLSQYTNKMLEEVILETYSKFNEDVVKHLLHVSSNIELSKNHTYEPVDVIDNALMNAVEEDTAGNVLHSLFKKVVDFSLELCEKEAIEPLLQGDVSRAVRLIKSTLEDYNVGHYFVIGSEGLTNQVIKHLSGSEYGSLTVLNRSSESQRSVEELKQWLKITNQSKWLKNIHVVDSSQLLYRLAKSDAIIIGPSEKNTWISEELINEMHVLRPTLKQQLFFDFSSTQDETVFSKFETLVYKHIDDEPKKMFVEDKVEAARTAYDELITGTTSQYMAHYNQIQECEVLPKPVKKRFKSNQMCFVKKIGHHV